MGYLIENNTKKKLSGLMSLKLKSPIEQVLAIREGEKREIPLEDISEGDFILIGRKEVVPANGIIIDGSAFVDESTFTGESISQERGVGERIVQGSRVVTGKIKYQVTSLPRKEVASIPEKKKDFCSEVLDIITDHYIWFLTGILAIALSIWIVLSKVKESSDISFISSLLIGYPCIMYIALSLTHSLGIKKGLEYGALIKEMNFVRWKSLNWVDKSQVVILDKTGTITEGNIEVKDIHPLIRISEDKLLQIAASLESKANHLVGEAIISRAENKQIELLDIKDSTITMGFGIKGNTDLGRLILGNESYIRKQGLIEKEAMEIAHEYELDGKSPVFIGIDNQIAGLISVMDIIRPDCADMISNLKKMDFQVVMITGDDQRIANMVAHEVGIEEVYRKESAQAKEKLVKDLIEQYNLTVMIGNGRNDVEALAMSDIGIALPDSEEHVMKVSNIILMQPELRNVPAILQLCSTIYSVGKQNWMWIGIYHAIGILVFIGVILGMKGILLSNIIDWVILGISLFVTGFGAIRLCFFQPKHCKSGENGSSCTKIDK